MRSFKTAVRWAERAAWALAALTGGAYLVYVATGLELFVGGDIRSADGHPYFVAASSQVFVPQLALSLALLGVTLLAFERGPLADRYADWWLRRLEESRWHLALALALKHRDSPTSAVVAFRRRSGLTVASSQDLMRRALAEVTEKEPPPELEAPVVIELEKERV